MNAVAQLSEAGRGWLELAIGRPGWRGRFVATREGLVVALGSYLAVVVAAILLQGVISGVPNPGELITGVLVNALPLLGIYLGLLAIRVAAKPPVPLLDMLVPAVHALTFLLVLGILLSFAGGTFSTVLLGILAFLLYRGGREILGLNLVFALAYAALSIVLLVALPLSLYMLLAPGPGGPI